MTAPQTEAEQIAIWDEEMGDKEYGWCSPGTWATLSMDCCFKDENGAWKEKPGSRGEIGPYTVIYTDRFQVPLFMNPWADEGFLFVKNLKFVSI